MRDGNLLERRRARWRRAAVKREERWTSSRAESCVERRGLASARGGVRSRRDGWRRVLSVRGWGCDLVAGCSLSRDWWNYRWCLGAVGGTLETREDAFRAGFWRFVRVRARHRTRGLLSPLSSRMRTAAARIRTAPSRAPPGRRSARRFSDVPIARRRSRCSSNTEFSPPSRS